jgi:hypothetical protein
MKYQKTTYWRAEFDSCVATITKYYDSADYFWKIQTKTLDFGFGDSWEWKILAEGKEETLAAARSAIKKAKEKVE